MDDEHTLREADARVRAALVPDDAAARRVVLRALAGDRRGLGVRRHSYAALGAAILALLLGASAWQWRRAAPQTLPPPSLAVVGRGPMIVVESRDGRRWIVGPPPERRTGGNFVIAVQK
jgi:hypothetical protein